MKKKRKKTISIILNLINVVIISYAAISLIFSGGVGNMDQVGPEAFRYFTVDSNILAAITSLLVAIDLAFKKGIRRSTLKLKFIGTVSVTVTFFTVICFLGPTVGYSEMFEGVNLFLHGICPLISMITFCGFEGSLQLNQKWINSKYRRPLMFTDCFLGMISVICYGALYYYMVIITEWWPDFYGFNSGIMDGKWLISIIAMLCMTFLISLCEWSLHIAFPKVLKK